MKFDYQVGEKVASVALEREAEGFRVSLGEQVVHVRASLRPDGRLLLEMEGQRWQFTVAQDGKRIHVGAGGQSWRLEPPQPRRRGAGSPGLGDGGLTASMPGLVLDVLVAPGDTVQRGETLVLLEAMKMELRITAPQDGVVEEVLCQAGQTVERGAPLVTVRSRESLEETTRETAGETAEETGAEC